MPSYYIDKMDVATTLFVYDIWAALVVGSHEVIAALALVSIGLVLLLHAFGGLGVPLLQVCRNIGKMILTLVLLGSWLWFTRLIYNPITDIPDWLTKSLLSSATGDDIVSMHTQMDDAWTRLWNHGSRVWEASGWTDGEMFVAIAIWIGAVLSIGYAALKIVIAKLNIAMLMAISPLILVLWNAPIFNGMFAAWLRQAVNAALTLILVYLVLMLFDSVITHGLTLADEVGAAEPHAMTVTAWLVLIMGGVWYTLRQAFAFSTGLSQGVSLSSRGAWDQGSRLTRNAMASGYNVGLGIGKAGQKLYSRLRGR